MKIIKLIVVFIIAGLLFTACSTSGSTDDNILKNQTGILGWYGSPSFDGVGILFEVEETFYGAPGDREDYSKFFPEDENQVMVKADIIVTGDSTMRGTFGTKFPEIEFVRIEKVQ